MAAKMNAERKSPLGFQQMDDGSEDDGSVSGKADAADGQESIGRPEDRELYRQMEDATATKRDRTSSEYSPAPQKDQVSDTPSKSGATGYAKSKEDSRSDSSPATRVKTANDRSERASKEGFPVETMLHTPADGTATIVVSKAPSNGTMEGMQGVTMTSMNVLTNMYSPVANPLKITRLNLQPAHKVDAKPIASKRSNGMNDSIDPLGRYRFSGMFPTANDS